ncbi:peptidoglycan DD-metalloendopeptidase family protein [Providencia stuartii]|uniref:glycoside hydrolase family protein n=1 Tax=Providencia stuartii TaxID=588 RepID=UPI000C99F437|nr:peptidoglycan DD-metalloendopeptidase family protein [Providencia stuartii]HEM8214742.1 peptidoglycan DD-metalloendopeptidase family protein [Providencia stuartii]
MIWQPFLQYLAKDAPQWKAYSEAFIEGMTWMQEVTKDKLVPSLWHMHPLVFLDAINTEKTHNIIFPLRTKPLNNPDGDFKAYNWRDRNKGNQTVFGRNRNGGRRKHAAIDLYTYPYQPIYAISDGVIFDISNFYSYTDQISIKHKTVDGREFIARYGEVDSNTVDVKVGQKVKQGQFLAKTGKLLTVNKKTKKLEPEMLIDGVVVFMLHFEYYTDGSNTKDKLTNKSNPPFQRRADLADPFDLLMEGYINTFETRNDLRMDVNSISISEKGKDFIKKWESKILKPYNDSEGYCTIGYGHLIGKDKCENMTLSNDFKNGITDEKTDELFDSDLIRFELAVKKEINVKLYQHEYDALVSLLFNCGSNFFSLNKAPKLLMLINSEQYELAANEFSDITNNGVLGLVRRRSAEKDVFLNANY